MEGTAAVGFCRKRGKTRFCHNYFLLGIWCSFQYRSGVFYIEPAMGTGRPGPFHPKVFSSAGRSWLWETPQSTGLFGRGDLAMAFHVLLTGSGPGGIHSETVHRSTAAAAQQVPQAGVKRMSPCWDRCGGHLQQAGALSWAKLTCMHVKSMTSSISYSFKLDANLKVVVSPIVKPIMNEYKNHNFKEVLIFFFLF